MQISLMRILNLANRAFDYILLMLMLLIGSLGIYYLWDASNTYKQANSNIYKQYKPSAKEDQSFDELKERNPDIKAWLTVKDTRIDYPVVQGDDNIYYLSRDVERTPASSGSIFIDSRCDSPFAEFNTIIYGHHMAYGSMFGDLDKYSEKQYFHEHLSGSLFCDGIEHGIQFFAFFDKADGYDKTIYSFDLHSVEDKESYLEYIEDNSIFFRNIGVSTNDRIVLLSTCSHTMTNGRYILVGKLGEKEPALAEGEEDVGMTWKEKMRSFFLVVPLLIWFLVILLIILLIVVLFMRKKMRKRR